MIAIFNRFEIEMTKAQASGASHQGRCDETGRKIKFNNREYRVYCDCFSNVGTWYIIVKGEKIILK